MRIMIAALLFALSALPSNAGERKAWRSGWAGIRREPGKVIACAKALRFNAIITGAKPEKLEVFAKLAKKEGIETYYWLSPVVRRKSTMKAYRQIMPPEDEKRLAELNADKDPKRHGYQSGGEPQPGHHEVLRTRLLCFHRPEVRAFIRKEIRDNLTACPSLTGIGLDYFGYQNYRYCACPHSMKLLKAYQAAHPKLPAEVARRRFSLDTLVGAINEMAEYSRSVRPGVKVTIHVYPTFLPEPLYGYRLDVDTCCQTVAWFFEPYWPDKKIERYTRFVVGGQNLCYDRQRGIPFVGVYVGRAYADKTPERLAHELDLIHRVAGNADLSVCSFNEFIRHPKVAAVVKRAYEKAGKQGAKK